VQPVLLGIGDAGFIEDGDELVFGDGIHVGSFRLTGFDDADCGARSANGGV
jgi:hypothetical protein